jgi:hypothetical protein
VTKDSLNEDISYVMEEIKNEKIAPKLSVDEKDCTIIDSYGAIICLFTICSSQSKLLCKPLYILYDISYNHLCIVEISIRAYISAKPIYGISKKDTAKMLYKIFSEKPTRHIIFKGYYKSFLVRRKLSIYVFNLIQNAMQVMQQSAHDVFL